MAGNGNNDVMTKGDLQISSIKRQKSLRPHTYLNPTARHSLNS
jgi:hypothetical protein